MINVNTIAPVLMAALGLFVTGFTWGAQAAQVYNPPGTTISSDPSTTDTGLHERLEPAGNSIRAYDAGPIISGLDCRMAENMSEPACEPYIRAHEQDAFLPPDDRSIRSTTYQRGGHFVTQTAVYEDR